jgi:hypothetical protein
MSKTPRVMARGSGSEVDRAETSSSATPDLFRQTRVDHPRAVAERIFQQAKNECDSLQFLQIVTKEGNATPGESKPKAEPKLTRVAFRVSRLMEFCTLRELQNQTGHAYHDWP